LVEDNKFSISVHYRNVPDEDSKKKLETIVDNALADSRHKNLVKRNGKMVWEIRPNFEWHKGSALRYILKEVFQPAEEAPLFPLYVGDDITDEDAFTEIRKLNYGIGVFVRPDDQHRATNAQYTLRSPDEVLSFLSRLSRL